MENLLENQRNDITRKDKTIHMTNDKQTVHFDMYYNQGYTCTGCAMIADLSIDIEFTNDEIARMRQLVSKVDEVDYSEGIMPVLKDEAPELYNRIDDVARSKTCCQNTTLRL